MFYTPRVRAHTEIEVKIRVADLRALRRRLRALGARAGAAAHEVNTLFDTASGTLRKRGRLLRLRCVGRRAIVTWKGPSQRASGLARYKVRQEHEWEISNAGALIGELARLDLRASFRYEKYRTEFRLPRLKNLKVMLDRTPMGDFMELEGTRRQIDRAASLLGYGRGDYLTSSYAGLYFADCRRRGRQPTHMLFPRRKSRKK